LFSEINKNIEVLTMNRWFSYVFTYKGDNHALEGFFNAIELVMETGFALTAFLSLILNLMLPEEIEDEETPELTANTIDAEHDQEEWNRIRRKSQIPRKSSDEPTDISKSAPGVSEEKNGEASV
jgi:NCS2 family nucleobase:cation symporter-2